MRGKEEKMRKTAFAAVLAGTGFWLGRTAGDITYLELVTRGKALATAHLPWVILGALVLVGAYIAASRLVMRRGK